MSPLLVTLLARPAFACDPAALEKALDDTSPARVGAAWVALADCNGASALKKLPATLERMIPGDEANVAAERAIALGQGAAIRAWVVDQEPDLKSATISWLGTRCAVDPKVSSFFLDAHAQLADAFWKDRWYRGLADCRTPEIQGVLEGQITSFTSGRMVDKTQLLSLLEVYARNARSGAIPTLTSLAGSLTDDELQAYVVNAFADTANLGSTSGVDEAAAKASTAAIVGLAPTLSDRALLQARTTLLALGDETASNQLVRYRWDDRWIDGYTYAVSAIDVATCGNGKVTGTLHTGLLSDAGTAWPEQIQEGAAARLGSIWGIDAGAKCKGTSEVTVTVSPEPTADVGTAEAWFTAQREAFTTRAGEWSKSSEVAHPVTKW